MAVYEVETEGGVYEVETEDAPSSAQTSDLTMGNVGQIAKTYGKEMLGQAQDVGKSFVRGATFGKAFPETEPSTFSEKPGSKLAEFVGGAVPMAAAAAVVPPAAVLGPISKGIAAGATYGAARSAATGADPLEATKNIAEDAAIFGGTAGLGQMAGYLRKVVGEKASEVLANWFTNTKPSVALERVQSGKPSVGKEFMQAKDSSGGNLLKFQGQEDTLKQVNNESMILKDQIEGRIRKMSGQGTPVVTTTPEIKPDVFGVGTRTGGENASAIMTSRGPALSVKNVADRDVFSNVMDDLIPVYEKYEDKAQLALLQKARLGGFLNLEESNTLRRILDSEIGNAHLKQMNDIPNKTGAMKKISNSIRSWIHKTDPELSDLFDKQHLMLTVRDGLQRAQASTLSGNTGGVFVGLNKRLAGSRFDAGAARTLNTLMGKPRPGISGMARYGTLGAGRKLSDSLSNER